MWSSNYKHVRVFTNKSKLFSNDKLKGLEQRGDKSHFFKKYLWVLTNKRNSYAFYANFHGSRTLNEKATYLCINLLLSL